MLPIKCRILELNQKFSSETWSQKHIQGVCVMLWRRKCVLNVCPFPINIIHSCRDWSILISFIKHWIVILQGLLDLDLFPTSNYIQNTFIPCDFVCHPRLLWDLFMHSLSRGKKLNIIARKLGQNGWHSRGCQISSFILHPKFTIHKKTYSRLHP